MRKSVVMGVLLIPLLCGLAMAQAPPVQVITYSAADTNNFAGWQNCYTCYCFPQQRTPTPGGNLDMTFTDTIGYSYVSIQVELAWGVNCAGGGSLFNVFLNGTQLGAGSAAPTSCQCYQSGSGVAGTQTFQGAPLTPGNSVYLPGASNVLRFTQAGASYQFGLTNNSSNWCVRLTITGQNQAPLDPTNTGQLNPGVGSIPTGGSTSNKTVRLRATVNDPDSNDCYLEAEVATVLTFFSNNSNFTGTAVASGQDAFVDATNLTDGSYHWHVRAVDPFDFKSGWVSHGLNSEVAADFIVNTVLPKPKGIDPRNHGAGDCNISVGFAGGLLSPALLGFALLAFGLSRRR